MTDRDTLIQLPNRDLWRGHREAPTADLDTETVRAEEMDPLNRAMADILKQGKGATMLTCIWCGQQGDERWAREHLKAQHKSVLYPATDAQVATHELGLAKAEVPKE